MALARLTTPTLVLPRLLQALLPHVQVASHWNETDPSVGSAGSVPGAHLPETRHVWRPHEAQGRADRAASAAGVIIGSTAAEKHGEALSHAQPAATQHAAGTTAAATEEVCRTLEGMGLKPGRNCVVGDGLAVVDVGLYLQGVKVALEMEEGRPSHTMATDARSYAAKRAMRSLLKAHGWHTVTLAASDWRKLDGEQREHYLAYCINHALGAEHGSGGHGHHHHHHHHHHDGGSCGSGCGHGDAASRHGGEGCSHRSHGDHECKSGGQGCGSGGHGCGGGGHH